MINKRTSYLLYVVVVITFFVLFGLLGIVYSNIVEKHKLEMKFNSEKAFNSIYMAMTENMSRAERIMKEEGVSAIGLYSTTGELFRGMGETPDTLPLNDLILHHSKGDDSTLGIYLYDESTSLIEYFRLSRLNVVLETGTLRFDREGYMVEPFPGAVPEILYVKFDGSLYFQNLNRSRTLILLGGLLLTGILVLLLYTFKANRNYRNAMARTEQLASLGTAARTLTHEIKNPLSSIAIQSAILKKFISPEYKGEIDILDHEVNRIASLTDKVTDFLKYPAGSPEEVDLVSFLNGITYIFPNDITKNFNGISYVTVSFDRDRLRSVFENLIKNAVESTQSTDNRDPKVEIELKLKRKNICVFVIDHGDGIPLSLLDKLFDPFFTTKTNGSGIGLSITKQFLSAQNASLKIVNTGHNGTVIKVIIPYIEVREN